ncbi:MAG: hypothetical protein AMXMBFR77_27800 [Phycisphaerales bacterium]
MSKELADLLRQHAQALERTAAIERALAVFYAREGEPPDVASESPAARLSHQDGEGMLTRIERRRREARERAPVARR